MIVTLDFETYYSTDYSLSKISEVDYILDPRFETIMCAVKEGSAPADIAIGHAQVARRLARIDWSRAALLAHNTRFDGAILFWHYRHTPALYLDTMAMARAMIYSHTGSASLASVCNYLGLPPKGDEVVRAIGKTLRDFTPTELRAYADYCLNDTERCRQAFDIMRTRFPNVELPVIDAALRMFIHPQVVLDPDELALAHAEAIEAKRAAFARVAHIDRSVFSSNQQFAKLLMEAGVEIPMKASPTTGQQIPALAKGDWQFKEMLADESLGDEVQALLLARMGAKSTIDETRAEKLLRLSLKAWPDGRGTGWATVPLRYCGAHTGRFSGDGGVNWQNFRRGSRIRAAVRAPDGYRIVHRDAAQIEARMVAWLARCWHLVRDFANGVDVYSKLATSFYGREVTKADKPERFTGKTGILSLQYGVGAPRFRHALFVGQGGVSVRISLEQATDFVNTYRYRRFPEIPELWKSCEFWLYQASGMQLSTVCEKPPAVEFAHQAVWLPNGLCIPYKNLRPTVDGVVYDGPHNETRKIYGAKITENISQALSRIALTEIMTRVARETGWYPFLSTHDSLDYCVPAEEAETFDGYLEREFAVVPEWAPGLPLASEGGWGVAMSDAENKLNT